MKHESEEKLDNGKKQFTIKDDEDFEQVIHLRRSDNPRKLLHSSSRGTSNIFLEATQEKSPKTKKPLKESSNTHGPWEGKYKAIVSSSNRQRHNIFDIEVSEEEKSTEKPFFNMKGPNP